MNSKTKVGLTGSIGSGKTLVSKILQTLGYPVYDSDWHARQFYFYQPVKEKIYDLLGGDVFDADKQIDIKAMAQVIFSDPAKLQKVNAIIHPYVAQDFEKWANNQSCRLVFQESAILFEAGFQDKFHAVISVSAPLELRIERVMKRNNVSRDEVLQRMQHQWSDEKKCRYADYIIANDGAHFIMPRIIKILEELSIV
ncbi:MAG: dephospho-CoA kinase [Bacteroidales bacterium]